MENGKWKMENGKWKMESGKWKVPARCRGESGELIMLLNLPYRSPAFSNN
jgi:hypothetical protein